MQINWRYQLKGVLGGALVAYFALNIIGLSFDKGVDCEPAVEIAVSVYDAETSSPVMNMESKHSAAEFLSAPDYKVRLAAILVCESTWKCGAEPKVVEACQEIAVSNAHDSFRICAIGSLSRVLNSSKSADISAFLANIILDSKNSDDVRVNAYWALREVQFGVSDTSFDNFLKGTFYTVKSILRDKPGEFAEDQVKSNLLAEGRVPEELWNSAEEIDWEFVRSFSKSN